MPISNSEESLLSEQFDPDYEQLAQVEAKQRRIVLHVYDDESKEFTSLTTYHGMVRIYNSNTWPSLIFWCLVVVTCVTLFMIHSSILLHFYLSLPTFLQETVRVDNGTPFPAITICQRPSNVGFAEDKPICTDGLFLARSKSCGNEWTAFEEDYEVQHNKSFSLKRVLLEWSGAPVRLMSDGKSVKLVARHRFLTEYGVCENFELYRNAPLGTVMLRIDDPFQDTLYSLQDDPTTSKLDGEPVHSPPGKGSSVVFRIVKEHFLEKGDRGFCSPNADIKACMERCKARTYYEKCGCLPFYMTDIFGNSFHECPPSVLISCVSNIKQPSNACDCLVGCARTKIEIVSSTRTLLPRRLRNSSMISVKQNSRIFTEYLQLKRFKTVDLLSFVAGSMGLFLGMSCVTLMEIFMYLFKSVWGMVNNWRHKEFLEKLLGETVDNPVEGTEAKDFKMSHEQIVITVNGRNDDEIITVDHKQLGNRRLSIVPLNRSKLDKTLYDSKWQLAIPPRLDVARSRASTIDSKYSCSFDQNS